MTDPTASDLDINEHGVETYLRERLEDPDLSLVSLKRIAGGMSRQTWFATVSGSEGERTLTFRLDHPGGSVVPVPLRHEYDIFAALTPTEVPVAAALWFENDPDLIGRAPFYVRETVPGSASTGYLFKAGNETMRHKIGLDVARQLARVHSLQWQDTALPEILRVPTTPQDCALLELAQYEQAYRDAEPEPMPVVEALLSWLKRNVPDNVQRTSLIWGDVGIGNFIYEGEKVVALSDWEQAHLGDPMKDWASAIWRGVDSLAPREEMFAVYEEESGLRIDLDRIHYYSVFIDAQYVCTSFPLVSEIGAGKAQDATFARLGLGVPYYCMDHGLRSIGY